MESLENKTNKDDLHGEKLMFFLGTFLLVSALGFATNYIINNSKLYQEVSEKADKNKNKIVDFQEWRNVYNIIEKKYDENLEPRKDLSNKDLRNYLKFQ